jgi:histidyl-tRNA synthetase
MATQQKSSNSLKAVRGTRDLLPPETALWNRVEATAREVFARYGFGEIRTPIFEDTQLFARGVGDVTDLVSKEMYTWADRDRIDRAALRDAWWKEAKQGLEPLHEEKSDADMVFRHSNGGITLVNFAERASGEAGRALWHSVKAYKQQRGLSDVVGTLVYPEESVSEGIPRELLVDGSVDSWAVRGNFFASRQSLTLRPENTAGVVRAYIEHKLGDSGQLQKLYYIGPQFRRERPQRGRYRQFWQIGCEVLGPVSSGSESPVRDAEVLEMLASLLDQLGIRDWQLQLNSVGSAEDRKRYNAALRAALEPVKAQLSEDNQRRAETNPLRVLDSKEPADQEIIDALPKIADFLDADSAAHFAAVRAALDACGVAYSVNPRLVRGLDYYTRTTFEFTVPDGSGLGTQNALLGGGRYDGLSEMLGGPKAPGIGFAIGEDRLILVLQEQDGREGVNGPHPEWMFAQKLDAYIAPMGVERNAAALALARELRRAGLSVEVGDGTFRLKKSFEAADQVARHIVILGEDEVRDGTATVKTFATGAQVKVARAKLIELLRQK